MRVCLCWAMCIVKWDDLRGALCRSTAPDEYGYSTISVNPICRVINGKTVELSCDYHVLDIIFIGKFKNKYRVKVRVDSTGTVRSEIFIEGIGDFIIFVSLESGRPTIPASIQSKLDVQTMEELYSIFDWIFNAYSDACFVASSSVDE